MITYLDVLTKASSNSEIIFAATTPIRTLIRVRFAIRVGGLYTQNIEHFPGDLLLVFYPFEQVPHELLVAFKYSVDVLMQTTRSCSRTSRAVRTGALADIIA